MTDSMITFALADVRTDDSGEMSARIVPFGEPVMFDGVPIRFERGSMEAAGTVPLTIDHGPGVLDRIGVMARVTEADDGAYAAFKFADTQTAQDVRSLIATGAVTDVSVGLSPYAIDDDGVMTGTLDHVSVVPRGRFGSTDNPSKVLAVHAQQKGADTMADAQTENTPAAEMAADPSELEAKFAELNAKLAEMAEAHGDAPVDPAARFTAIEAFAALTAKNAGIPVANHALADVVGDLGTADASGLYYDEYWGAGIQHLLDARRPLFATAGAAPFPGSGENLVVPRVTQSTAVTAHSAEKAAVASQALQVEKNSFPTVWFTGAVDISLELISQGYQVVPTVLNDMMTQYAKAVEADATSKLQAAATASGAALDTATYAGLVQDLIVVSNLIEDATGLPGDICAVTPTQWASILGLMDGGDRRQFAMVNGRNQDGSGSLVTRGIDVGGIFVFRAPDAGLAMQYNQQSYKAGEKTPMQVASTNVELFGRDIGVGGATVNVIWPAGVYKFSA